jgi:pimeloyl-ACP methyl ester carboxylesterase
VVGLACVIGITTVGAFGQPSKSIEGSWNGEIEVPGVALKTTVRLSQVEGDKWSGEIDIPQQGARAVPLTDVTIALPNVSFRIAGIPGDPTFRLVLAEDSQSMSGTLTQGGGTIPATLRRGDAPAAAKAAPRRPQTPVPPMPYLEEQVTFRNEGAGLQLAGTLTLPRAEKRVAAVLLITGSGQQDRDQTLFGHKPFWVWADYLTRMGVAVLRVDDRGIGGSGRGSSNPTSLDFATDVRAGLDYLRRRPEIDPDRVGLIGHSEGAMLAVMVAATAPAPAFIVMLAGTGLPGEQILYSQAASLFKAQGASDEAIAWDRSIRERVFAILKAETEGKPDVAAREKLLEEIGSAKPVAPGAPDGAAARQLANALFASSQPWLQFFLAFDPRPTLMRVRCPVLAIGGERDVQVPARENLREIERALRTGGNKDVITVPLPGLNHLMQTSVTGLPNEYATIEETISPAVLKLVSDWIAKRVS